MQAEALDALMDALSEDCSDQACKELQLVHKLRNLLPALQHKVSRPVVLHGVWDYFYVRVYIYLKKRIGTRMIGK